MSESFDPYYRWLGIPPEDQPADHYRLLGLRSLEENLDAISNAADRQMAYLRSLRLGKHSALCEKILNEIASARICLLNPSNKAAYDQQLGKADSAAQSPSSSTATSPTPTMRPAPQKSGAEQLPAVPMSRPKADMPKATQRPPPRPVPLGDAPTAEAHDDPLGSVVDLAAAAALESQSRDDSAGADNARDIDALWERDWETLPVASSTTPNALATKGFGDTSSSQPTSQTWPMIEWLGTPAGRWTAIGAAVVAAVGLLGVLLFLLGQQLSQGELIVSSPTDGLRVAIKSDGRLVRTATLDEGDNRFTLPAGTIEIELAEGSADFEISCDDAQLVPLGTVHIQLHRPPAYLLASASADGTIGLWDPHSGRKIHTLTGHDDVVTFVNFSADGSILASASYDATIKLWDPATGQMLRTLTGHSTNVYSVAFSADGSLLASASSDKTVKLWDPATGEELRTLTGHGSGVFSVAFSPDGSLLASGSNDGTIKLWNLREGREQQILRHGGTVSCVTFSPDGSLLASGSLNNTINLWDPGTGQVRRSLGGHVDGIQSLAFSADGSLLASASMDTRIKLWNPSTGEEQRTLTGHRSHVFCVAFSPDGSMLASGGYDEAIYLSEPATGQKLRTLTVDSYSSVRSVAFSPLLSQSADADR